MKINRFKDIPRLPLDGSFDMTYRCNNSCHHCWLWLPQNAKQKTDELSFEEIRSIVDDARAMGCQAWSLSGGEPMLRPDFIEIFDYITRKSVYYNLNTNGTLITPEIARLLARKGNNMVAIYGATADVHDSVTRNPGSFETTMRGFSYLTEAGANFSVQIVPMKANYHQYSQMVQLAQSLSSNMRVGAPWLWLSACHSEKRNFEINEQRLDPKEVIMLDLPNPINRGVIPGKDSKTKLDNFYCGMVTDGDHLFADCINGRHEFHIDPYGQMSFCAYIKDPALRYNLREGTFKEAWDEFIPSLGEIVHGGQEFFDNCGSCDLRCDCRWCAVFSYLETGRYSAKVDYLCQVAKENRRYKEEWSKSHLRYFQIAGIVIRVSADFPIKDDTFDSKFDKFLVNGPGPDTISVHLNSSVPKLSDLRLGKEVYHKSPWAIYKQRDSWVYMGISEENVGIEPQPLALINKDYTQINICRDPEYFIFQNLHSLTTFTSDQILLAQVFADHEACYIHSSGIIIDGQGFLFIGHSDAGKSTMIKMLRGHGEILCDDRNIVRRWPEGFRVHGTWSHGELPDVSPAGAPLRAILFLEQADTNELIPVTSDREKLGRLLSHVIKALITEDWWDKILSLMGKISAEVPIYRLRFDKSGKVLDVLRQLL